MIEINRLMAEGHDRRSALNQLTERGVTLNSRSLDFMRQEQMILETRLANASDLNSKIELGNSLRNQEIRLVEAAARHQANFVRGTEQGVAQKNRELQELLKGAEALKRQNEAIKNVDSGGRQLLKTLTGISKSHEKSLAYALSMAGGKGFGAAWMQMRDSLLSVEGASDVLGSSLQKVQEATIGVLRTVANLNAQYAQQTGRANENTAALTRNWRALTQQFASLEDVQGARIALMSQGARFIHMNAKEQDALIQLGTSLNQVGVNMTEFTQRLNLLQVGFQMNTSEIVAFENRLFALGQQVGFSAMQISRDWTQSQNILAKYGKQSEQVFAGLTRASKETGVGIGSLIGITDQFTTFEGAANIVGRFNALLGGPYLNTIEMVYATDAKRLQLLRQVFKQSGLNWQQMSDQERLAFAWSAGIKDMAMAAKLFGTTDAVFRAHNLEQQRLADLAAKSKDVFDKFKVSMMRLAVAIEPLLVGLGKLADWLAGVLPQSTEGMTSLVIKLGLAYSGVNMALKYMMQTSIQANAIKRALGATTMIVTTATGTEAAAIGARSAVVATDTAVTWRNVAAKRAQAAAIGGVAGALIGFATARGVAAKTGSKKSGMYAGALAGGASGAIVGGMMGGVPGALIGGGIGAAAGIYGGYSAPQAFQHGGRTGGGAVIVGDRRDRNLRGAEIVAPRGTNVISAQQTGEILAASQINKQAMATLVSAIGRLAARMDNLIGSITSLRARPSGGREVEKTVVMNVDGRTLGSVVVDVLRDRHEIGLAST
jgi:hypothetical protein